MGTTHESLLASLKEEHEELHTLRAHLEDMRRQYLDTDASSGKWQEVQAAIRDFADHLDRHFSFEEQDGFLLMVVQRVPTLAATVEELRTEHDELREDFNELNSRCQMADQDGQRREWIGPKLDELFHRLGQHEGKENPIVQEAFYRALGRS